MYARTKRAQVILTELWAKRLAGTGVVVHAMHPGWVDTPGVASSLPRFHRLTGPLLRSPEQGADTIVWLGAAAEPGESSGGFWHDRRRRPTHRVPWTRETPEDRERLWRECERLTGWHAVPRPGSDPRAPIGRSRWRTTPQASKRRVPRRDVRVPQRLLHNGAVGPGRRRGAADRRRPGRARDRVPAGRRVPRPQDRTHLPDRRVRAGRSRHAAGRERDRRLARQDHVRAVRRRARGSPTTPTSR